MVTDKSVAASQDSIRFLYNLCTCHQAARIKAVESDCINALWRILKSQDDESLIIIMGRIAKEVCCEAFNDAIHKKLLADGIMNMLLRLSKIEIPQLKYDISCCLYALTTAGDILKVLKWDAVDILFWLTIHDCLNLYDPIK